MAPLRYQGSTVPGCVTFGSRSRCPSLAGKWIACGPGATGAAAAVTGNVTQLRDAARVTTDARACELPVVYGVRALPPANPCTASVRHVCASNHGHAGCCSLVATRAQRV